MTVIASPRTPAGRNSDRSNPVAFRRLRVDQRDDVDLGLVTRLHLYPRGQLGQRGESFLFEGRDDGHLSFKS